MKNTKLLLEFGCNHQGDFEIATEMVIKASELGVWGVKFQKRDIEDIPDEVKKKPRNMSNSFGENYYLHRKALEFTNKELKELKLFAEKNNLEFVCSAFDEKSIDDLISIGCKYIKLPSQLLTRIDLRNKLIELRSEKGINFKILVSTGMHEWKEINNNIWLDYADIIFHCVSTYPAKVTEINLKTISDLKDITHAKIGYSSHENEGYGIKFAVFAGAEYIERHFTLDTEMKGSDHGTVSSDPDEVKRIIADIEWAEKILGTSDRICKLKEREVRKIYRGF